MREYLAELEIQNPVEEPTHSQDKVSTTDPDSTYATKGGTPARMGYYNNYLIDNDDCIVVGVQATGARLSEESRSAQRHDHSLRPMARPETTICRCRCELWQR